MNSAEGKGPKQVKRSWPLGQFVTIYGNGNNAYVYSNYQTGNSVNNTGTVAPANPAPVAYPTAFSGGQVGNMVTSGIVKYTSPGSVNPGLNLSPGLNNNLDISPICSPGSIESLQDIQAVTAVLNPEPGFTGTAKIWLQGTFDRYTPNAYFTSVPSLYASQNWSTIASTVISGSGFGATLISVPIVDGIFYPAYRLVASGGTGIIDWVLPGMFIDLSAMQVGQEATWVNGGIGQPNIADSDVLTISGGSVTGYNEIATPFENIKANHNFIG